MAILVLDPGKQAQLLALWTAEAATLGLTFLLAPGTPRPRIAVTHPATGGAWSV